MPFDENTMAQLFQKIKAAEYELPPFFSNEGMHTSPSLSPYIHTYIHTFFFFFLSYGNSEGSDQQDSGAQPAGESSHPRLEETPVVG